MSSGTPTPEHGPSDVIAVGSRHGDRPEGELRWFLTKGAVFAVIGLALYAGVYGYSERLVHRYAQTNKFFLVQHTPPTSYDYVIVGASHAAALGYQDMTHRLEAMTGTRIQNLALVGGGVRVSRLIYEYFLTRHRAGTLVYVIDSFAFYSRTWNEERLQDTRLFLRAPFDLALARLLLGSPDTRAIGFDYLVGFSKINNKDRFSADATPEETTRFNRAYRPVKQIDDQRLDYLYPKQTGEETITKYLREFEDLLEDAKVRGMRVIVVKPPIPERIAVRIPGEMAFDNRLRQILDRVGAPFHDFTHVGNDDKLFYDTDHLNRDGVLAFFETSLAPVLAASERTK